MCVREIRMLQQADVSRKRYFSGFGLVLSRPNTVTSKGLCPTLVRFCHLSRIINAFHKFSMNNFYKAILWTRNFQGYGSAIFLQSVSVIFSYMSIFLFFFNYMLHIPCMHGVDKGKVFSIMCVELWFIQLVTVVTRAPWPTWSRDVVGQCLPDDVQLSP